MWGSITLVFYIQSVLAVIKYQQGCKLPADINHNRFLSLQTAGKWARSPRKIAKMAQASQQTDHITTTAWLKPTEADKSAAAPKRAWKDRRVFANISTCCVCLLCNPGWEQASVFGTVTARLQVICGWTFSCRPQQIFNSQTGCQRMHACC